MDIPLTTVNNAVRMQESIVEEYLHIKLICMQNWSSNQINKEKLGPPQTQILTVNLVCPCQFRSSAWEKQQYSECSIYNYNCIHFHYLQLYIFMT